MADSLAFIDCLQGLTNAYKRKIKDEADKVALLKKEKMRINNLLKQFKNASLKDSEGDEDSLPSASGLQRPLPKDYNYEEVTDDDDSFMGGGNEESEDDREDDFEDEEEEDEEASVDLLDRL